MAQEDSGLVKRGMALLIAMSVLVVIVLVILFRRTEQPLPTHRLKPELAVLLVGQPAAAYPVSVSWPALWQLQEVLPSAVGWEIRYNATQSLCLIGSSHVAWDVMREMLDEDRQMRNFRVEVKEGVNVPNETEARKVVINALRALTTWHEVHQGPVDVNDLRPVYDAVERLTRSASVEVKSQAEALRSKFMHG